MKLPIILAILLILIGGCSTVQDPPSGPTIKTTHKISGTQELVLNEQDLQQLGMTSDGTDCQTEEYQTNGYSPLAQYSFCNYTINSLNDTQVVLELQKFTNVEDRNGTYQYSSLHLRGFEGLISENDYGDLSRLYVNNESTVYYYHLWIGKDEYLIHITSKGTKEAGEYIAKIGRRILSKFG
ncbi:TPA: hypothetical protein HA281_02810 [Candidatus Woesearchaeota archaeon]|nr:MAG: hypothetical protein QT04_C0015G0009 [archaeon GW2011_AR11]HIH04835.1 hypothetical protein [Candidatus Woesearchaeota archaeon]HIH91706.1 hypothetical protein [Candidatus Woesearchaeota archaeon]HII64265.1 hypothetical protein [Candidatus Woesearchaeota archaeon]HIJ18125.1 hypothetical protein [Candidatus Woesearchaeota archaeon]